MSTTELPDRTKSKMREDISFQTSDGVTLRGWFYKPSSSSSSTSSTTKLPCLVMAHGFSALKEMDLDAFAEAFVSALPISCLVYDNRGFGASDAKEGSPRQEIIPSVQISDYQDAITHAQMREDVDGARIGVWGSSYSGGHVIVLGAIDRRVKAVLCQAPLVDGWQNFHRLIRPDFVGGLNAMFEADRHARASGKAAGTIPVVDQDPSKPSALPTPDSFEFFSAWEKKSPWKNEVTVRSVEMLRAYDPSAFIHRISPTPLLMTVSQNDVLTPTDLAIEAFMKAREPKQLNILPGGHFEAYTGGNFDANTKCQTEFLRKWLCGSA